MKNAQFVLPVHGTVAILIAIGTTFLIFWIYQDSHNLNALWGLVGYLLAGQVVSKIDTTTEETETGKFEHPQK